MTLSKAKIKYSNARRIASIGMLVAGCTLLLPNGLLRAQNLIQPRVVLSGPKNAQSNAQTTNSGAQTGNGLRVEGPNSGFSQMSIPQAPQNQDNVQRRSTGRFIAVEDQAASQRQQQSTQSPSTSPPKFNLETRPLSSNIVESSRRAINSAINNANDSTAYQDSPASSQNTQRRSGWGVENSRSQANQHSTNQYNSGQNRAGQNRVDQAVAYGQQDIASIQRASFSKDLPENQNSKSFLMESSKLFDNDRSMIENEIASPNDAINAESASGTSSSATESKSEPRKKLSITNTVQKVAVSTVAILFLSVVSIVVLKKLGYAGPAKKKHSEPEFDVIETKRLSGKCQLQLVKIRNHKVIVGIDQSGIKSMVCLPQSFADEYDEATASETELDQAMTAESNAGSIGLNESSSVADLMSTDVASLIEAERRKSMSGSQADQTNSASTNVFSKTEIRTDEPEPTRSTLRRKPIRRFHPYEIAGGGNSTE